MEKQETENCVAIQAEYRALALSTCEAKLLCNLYSSIGILHSNPITIFCDNESAIHIANNPGFHERTKHIDMVCHFVRDEVQDKVIHLLPISSKEQTTDLLTKPLSAASFQHLKSKLGMRDIYLPSLRGYVSK
jgi:hypothetical protein